MKAMLLPGNGNSDVNNIWFPSVKEALKELGLDVVCENMPDPMLARKEFWLPFIEKKAGEDAILIGHSSGAIAILKYAETHKVKLAIFVGGYVSNLNDENEKASGYFDEPFNWEKIRENIEKSVVFASVDDPYIPIEEARELKDNLDAEYHEYLDEGHMGVDVDKVEFPELLLVVKKFLK